MSLSSMMATIMTRSDSRSRKALANIIAMLFLKGGNILIGLLLVPLTINYVDSDTYGIWLTISSMVAWIAFFDIGINNGLKNKLTESLANGDIAKAKAYVSTTYAILTLIFLPLMLLLLMIVPMLDWQGILNVSNVAVETLVCSLCIVVVYFCINFVLSTVNIVMIADQRPAAEALRVFIQQLLSLAVIFAMTKLVPGSLVNLCLALCLCPMAVMLLFNITLFHGRYKDISPSIEAINFKLAPDLLKLGVMFFVIQIAAIIQYQMINFLIMRYFGPNEVTAYNIAYKYFNIIYMVWTILTTPIWAAVADAITKKDIIWIKNTIRKYLFIFVLFAAGSLAMLLISPWAYNFWIGDSVTVAFSISLWVMLYNLAFMFGSLFVSVLNGASILKAQTICSLISPVLFIIASRLMIDWGWGIKSILIASILSNFNGLIIAPLQYSVFIRKNIKGTALW